MPGLKSHSLGFTVSGSRHDAISPLKPASCSGQTPSLPVWAPPRVPPLRLEDGDLLGTPGVARRRRHRRPPRGPLPATVRDPGNPGGGDCPPPPHRSHMGVLQEEPGGHHQPWRTSAWPPPPGSGEEQGLAGQGKSHCRHFSGGCDSPAPRPSPLHLGRF